MPQRGGLTQTNQPDASTTKAQSAGFTLIEIVLVLAIGGLIFLLAFLAFRQASTTRRDSQRRSDVNKIVAELENLRATGASLPLGSFSGPPTGVS